MYFSFEQDQYGCCEMLDNVDYSSSDDNETVVAVDDVSVVENDVADDVVENLEKSETETETETETEKDEDISVDSEEPVEPAKPINRSSPNKAINKDSGCVEFQIKALTAKITKIQHHLNSFRKDYHSKVTLYMCVARRKKYLKYFAKQNPVAHAEYLTLLKAEKAKRKTA